MKKLLVGIILLFGLSAVAQQAGPPPGMEIPSNMKAYVVAFLVEGPGTTHNDPQMMKDHLAFIRKQIEAGKVVMAGPFRDQGKIAGMFILNVATVDDAKSLLSEEPMTKAGWVTVEAHPAMLPDLTAVKVVYPAKKAQ